MTRGETADRMTLVANSAATASPTKLVKNQLGHVTWNLRGVRGRKDKIGDKEYRVVPMVMLTEGVHAGSQGPLYYPADELEKMPAVWNHKPIVVYHPTINGQGVSACDPAVLTAQGIGIIMNTEWRPPKLVAEAWIDEDRAKKVDNRIVDALDKGEVVELSTGLFTDNEREEGEWKGEKYKAVARNYRPDHLAVLPDQKGACSIADGAGLARNKATEKKCECADPKACECEGDEDEKRVANVVNAFCPTGKDGGVDPTCSPSGSSGSAKSGGGKSGGKSGGKKEASGDRERMDKSIEDGKGGGSDPYASDPKKAWKADLKAAGDDPVKIAEADHRFIKATKPGDAKAIAASEANVKAMTARYGPKAAEAAAAVKAAEDGPDPLKGSKWDGTNYVHPTKRPLKNEETAVTNEASHNAKHQLISKALMALLGVDQYAYVEDVFDSFFVYSQKRSLWKMDYEATDTEATLIGQPTEVVRVVQYRSPDGEIIANVEGSNVMDKKLVVDRIIANGAGAWTDKDREYLMTKDVEALQKIAGPAAPTDNKDVSKTPVTAIVTANAAPAPAAPAAPKVPTVNEYIANAPPEIAQLLGGALRTAQAQKDSMVAAITANARNPFTKEELQGKTIEELQKIAAFAAPTANAGQPAPNYGGLADAFGAPRGVPAQSPVANEEPLLPTVWDVPAASK